MIVLKILLILMHKLNLSVLCSNVLKLWTSSETQAVTHES